MASTAFQASLEVKSNMLKAAATSVRFPDLRELAAAPDPQAAFRTALLQVEAATRKMERHISGVEGHHTAWLDYIKQLRTAAERANEASTYQTVTEAPDNFLTLLGEARDVLDDLITAKLNLELQIAPPVSPIRTKQDRRIVEKWTREIEKEESIFDAPPLPDISEERLQWVLGMIEKNHQAWEQSAEEKGKSMVDSVRDDAEEIIEAASEAIEKSSVTLAKELEDRLALAMDDRGSDRRRISNRVCRSDIPLPTVRPVLHKILPCTVPTQGKKIERSST
ncbi:hypothetical protein Tcan_14783 [Toxocara canis]|uniref:Uncharacterized protein n=1 Tax=Toxocara canis TaxID=6265 RepID=A0A0B2UVH3_TOXCA|nr:hypothetical protein Tcan_14783 [Toxocara canis]